MAKTEKQISYRDGILDITAPEIVSVETNHSGSILWVNVDDVCVLRICRIGSLKIIDIRS